MSKQLKGYGLANYKSPGKQDIFRHNSIDVHTKPKEFDLVNNNSYESIKIFDGRKNRSLAYQKSEKIKQVLYE